MPMFCRSLSMKLYLMANVRLIGVLTRYERVCKRVGSGKEGSRRGGGGEGYGRHFSGKKGIETVREMD